MEFHRRRARETRKRNNDSSDNDENDDVVVNRGDGGSRRPRGGEAPLGLSPKRLRTAKTGGDGVKGGVVGGGDAGRTRDARLRSTRGETAGSERRCVEEVDYQAMCSSQGPTSAGVTWDFSSPSPSQYKKFSQRSYAKREEETNRIAEQMKSDGIQSRFLVGNLGKGYDRHEEDNTKESSSIDSIAALAKLNKKNPVGTSASSHTTKSSSSTRSILDEVQRLHLELKEAATKVEEDDEDGEETNLDDSSLGVRPLETSDDDDLGRRYDEVLSSDVGRRAPRNPSSPLSRVVEGGSDGEGGRGRSRVAAPAAAVTSTPKIRSDSGEDHADSRCSPTATTPTTPTLNRSFPRPTQSVSPEFPPESPRPSSPEEYSTGIDETRISGRRSSALDSGASRVETPPAANGFVNSIFDASSDGRGSDSSKSSKSVVDRVKNAVFQDEEWSDLDESLFVIKATQAEEEIQKNLSSKQTSEALDRESSVAAAGLTTTTATASAPDSAVSSSAVPPTPPSVDKKRKLALARNREERRKANDKQLVDLTLSDEDAVIVEVATVPTASTMPASMATSTIGKTAKVADSSPTSLPLSSSATNTSLLPSKSRDATDTSSGFPPLSSTSSNRPSTLSKNPLRLKVLRRSISPRRHLSPPSPRSNSSALLSPIPPAATAQMHPPTVDGGANGASTPPAMGDAASSSFCFSDVDDVDLSFVEAASQRLEEERERDGKAGRGFGSGGSRDGGGGGLGVLSGGSRGDGSGAGNGGLGFGSSKGLGAGNGGGRGVGNGGGGRGVGPGGGGCRKINGVAKNDKVVVDDMADFCPGESASPLSSSTKSASRGYPPRVTSTLSISNDTSSTPPRSFVKKTRADEDDGSSERNAEREGSKKTPAEYPNHPQQPVQKPARRHNPNQASQLEKTPELQRQRQKPPTSLQSLTNSTKDAGWSDDEDLDDATLALLIEEVESPKNGQLQSWRDATSTSSSKNTFKRSCSFPPRPPPPQTDARPLSSFTCSEPTPGSDRKSPLAVNGSGSAADNLFDSAERATTCAATERNASTKLFKSSSFSTRPRSSNDRAPRADGGRTNGSSNDCFTGVKAALKSSLKAAFVGSSSSSSGAARLGKRPASFASVYKPVVTALPSPSSSTTTTTIKNSTSSSGAQTFASRPSSTNSSFRRHRSAAQLTSHLRPSLSSEASSSSLRSSTTVSGSSTATRSNSLVDIEEDDDDSLFDVFRKADEICQAFAASQKK